MKSALLFAVVAVALSGFVQAGGDDIEAYPGKCHHWLLEIEEHNRRKEEPGYDGHKDEHAYKHEMVPVCDDHGNFVPKQCHVFKHDDEWCQPNGVCFQYRVGEKWCACVDVYSGMPDKGTMVLGGDHLYCDAVSKPYCAWDWMKFGEPGYEKCYKFIDTPMTWVDAERVCQWHHGHLTSIHCHETNRFLQELTQRPTHVFPLTWIGGTNAVKACFWFWSDGEFFDYDEFYSEDNMVVADSCLSFNFHFKWATKTCNETLPFICAKKPMMSNRVDLDYYHH